MYRPTRKLRYANPYHLNALERLLQPFCSDKDAYAAALFDEFGQYTPTIIRAAFTLFRRCLLKQVSDYHSWGISMQSNADPRQFYLVTPENIEFREGAFVLYNESQFCVFRTTYLMKNTHAFPYFDRMPETAETEQTPASKIVTNFGSIM